MNIADIVKTARERRGLTKAELAEKAGLSLPAIYGIETGRRCPRMDTMMIIMDALDYDIIFNPRYRGGYTDE